MREAENIVADLNEDLANTPKANRAAVTAIKHRVVDAEDEAAKSKQTFIEGIINLLCLAEVVPFINSGFNRIVRIRRIEIRLAREQRAVAREAQQQLQIRTDRRAQLSRRSLKLRLEQLQQHAAQKRQLEQPADEQPVVKRARQDNASPVMQYDGPEVECEVSLEQDPVATDFEVAKIQQDSTNYSTQFVQNNPEKPRTLWSTNDHWDYIKTTLFEMQNLNEPISNLLCSIVETNRLNRPPTELQNRILQLEQQNAVLEADKCLASFQQIEQQRAIDQLREQLQRKTEEASNLALHKSLTTVLQRKADDLQRQLQQQQQEADISTTDLFSQADLDNALSSVPGCSNAQQSFIDEVARSDPHAQPTVALFSDYCSLS